MKKKTSLLYFINWTISWKKQLSILFNLLERHLINFCSYGNWIFRLYEVDFLHDAWWKIPLEMPNNEDKQSFSKLLANNYNTNIINGILEINPCCSTMHCTMHPIAVSFQSFISLPSFIILDYTFLQLTLNKTTFYYVH